MRQCIGLVIVLVVGLCVCSATALPPDEQQVDQLIQQLGSGKFAEREAAQKALASAGPEVLEPLRLAANSPDPEISRRAKDLIPVVERRAETQLALSSKRFAFRVKDATVPEAVRELAKQAGVAIALSGDTSTLANQKLTLETPELSFWEVLDRFSVAAGLVESFTPLKPQPNPGQFNPGVIELRGLPGQSNGSRLQAIQLAAGKPQPVPTAYAQALRVRALPASADDKPGQGEASVTLELRLEPQRGWYGRPRVRIDEAMDEKNQALTHLPAEDNNAAQTEQIILNRGGGQIIVQQRGVVIGGANRMILEDLGGGVAANENLHRIPVRFKLPDEPGQSLKSLKGQLTGEMPLPVEDLLTIDNIVDVPKADKKTFKGKGDLSVTINAVSLGDDGVVKVTFEVTGEQNLAGGPGVQLQAIRGPRGQMNFEAPALQGHQIKLLDADGKVYRLTGSSNSMQMINGLVSNSRVYTFNPPTEKSTAKKFVISGSRLAKVEIPFVLKDVPLGK